MLELTFKDVGQGDSIILEWTDNGINKIGIIDCNLYNNQNPTLEYLRTKPESTLEFIILSHFHSDHFSGMADIFQHCIDNKIKVYRFYHTIYPCVGEIYNRIFTSKKTEKDADHFIEKLDEFLEYVDDSVPVTSHLAQFKLTDNLVLSFLAPTGKIYQKLAKQIARKVNRIVTTTADINKLSTIVSIEHDGKSILLTSDAVRNSFKILKNRITSELVLTQVPHHGSWASIDENFWTSIKQVGNCPSVFSVGDEPKDKLPNVETVAFFAMNNFDVYSTNNVYGIAQHFKLKPNNQANQLKRKVLSSFSNLRKPILQTVPAGQYNGEQRFKLF